MNVIVPLAVAVAFDSVALSVTAVPTVTDSGSLVTIAGIALTMTSSLSSLQAVEDAGLFGLPATVGV